MALNADGSPAPDRKRFLRTTNDRDGRWCQTRSRYPPGLPRTDDRVTNARFSGGRYDYAKERETYSLGLLGEHKFPQLAINYGRRWAPARAAGSDNSGEEAVRLEVLNVGV